MGTPPSSKPALASSRAARKPGSELLIFFVVAGHTRHVAHLQQKPDRSRCYELCIVIDKVSGSDERNGINGVPVPLIRGRACVDTRPGGATRTIATPIVSDRQTTAFPKLLGRAHQTSRSGLCG